jgi:single-stranded-DNA-specific exonuclease
VSRAIRRRPSRAGAGLGTGVSPLLARVYAARGIVDPGELDQRLDRLLPPTGMLGLGAAAQRLAAAMERGERILVIGDYDADGATSSALALLALRAMGCADADFLVPNRFEHGYGLGPEIVAVAARSAPRLIVTVDNGIASHAGVAAARAHGIDVIVTDHHLPGDTLPDACVIVNPNQPGCAFPSKHLAGVGVVFYLIGALRARLRDEGWFARRGLTEPNLGELLDLVALGTVADVVPLDANNRVLVRQGLQRIRAGRGRPGVRALLELAGRDPARAVASDLGFAVGPRINAAGRLDDIGLGIRCLLESDPLRAREMAAQLDVLNRERRDIENGMQQDALRLIGCQAIAEDALPWGPCLYHPDWHQGVVGLVASRIKERHHRPVIAFAPGAPGELKGSARSIRGFHIRDAIAAVAAASPGLVQRFGGHAMAAGLTLRAADFETFASAFDAEVRQRLEAADLDSVVESDGELEPGEFSLAQAEELRDAGPWGQHFPEPLFDGSFLLRSQRLVGGRHLRLVVAPLAAPGIALDAIAFNVDATRWPDPRVERLRLAYRLDVNEFRGVRSLQLLVEELQPAGGEGSACTS